jgi:hypothetical protein
MNEPTELQKQQLQMMTQFDWVFALAGTLFLTIGACWIGYQTYWGQGTALIEGRVVHMKMSDGKGGLFPVVAYTVDGKVFEVQGISTKPPAYSVGDPAMVRYRTDNPADAVLNSFIQRWLLPVIFTGLGAIFVAVFGRGRLRSRQ